MRVLDTPLRTLRMNIRRRVRLDRAMRLDLDQFVARPGPRPCYDLAEPDGGHPFVVTCAPPGLQREAPSASQSAVDELSTAKSFFHRAGASYQQDVGLPLSDMPSDWLSR